MSDISVKQLYKSFQENKILDGINLSVRAGEVCVILGRSGTGKSVLLKHILGLLKPDQGEVFVEGNLLNQLKEKELARLRLNIGMVFQSAALFDSMNVFENVAFMLLEHSLIPKRDVKARVRECLELVDLKDIEMKMSSELSGGMRKRVAIARAIAANPKIMLYDEPTTGLDPITSQTINDLMIKLNKTIGVTSLVVTHNINSALSVANKIIFLKEGRVSFEGSPEDVRNTSDPWIQEYLKQLD